MSRSISAGSDELHRAARPARRALIFAFVFSAFVNLLTLTAPLYMLQIYDRVLASRSEPTLVALSLLVCFLFLVMGILDHARSRILARIGARLQAVMDPRVLSAAFRRLAVAPGDTRAHAAQRDLDTLARLWSSPLLTSVLDLPWSPIFLAAMFIFHPVLGWFALAAMGALILVTWANQRLTSAATNEATQLTLQADRRAENLRAESELVRAFGMTGRAFARWNLLRERAQVTALRASDTAGAFATGTKTLRLFLQSAILGLGAWLVLREELSPGAMIAGSILLGRALQPVEIAIGQWALLTRANDARRRLSELLTEVPPEAPRTALPRPAARLEVQGLTVIPPGGQAPVIRNVSFALAPGMALGVIGPSGSGKSSVARAMIGAWPPAAGTIRLDGATLDQYDPDVLGSYIGYLPQRVTLFDGTVAENIARLDPAPDPAAIIEAARKADVHDMILRLPQGYDTVITTQGGQLSGGQIQRIGLARAFYGDPVLLVLDEPNSNLDNDGSIALNTAIRTAKAAGAAVMIMAHRPAAILECELLLVMKDGLVSAFGPRDQILREAVRNVADITRSGQNAGGVA